MELKKGCLTILLVVFAVPAAFWCWIVFATQSAAVRANDLLNALTHSGIAGVYAETSTVFRVHHSLDDFERQVTELGLDRTQSCSWTGRVQDGAVHRISGTVILDDLTEVSIELQFINENGRLRLYALGSPLVTDPSAVPPEPTVRQHVLNTLQALDESVRTEDFTPLIESTSKLFREEYSADRIKERFGFLIQQATELGSLQPVDIEFSKPPEITGRSILVAEGTAHHVLYDYHFKFDYLHEAGDWRLISCQLRLDALSRRVVEEFIRHLGRNEFAAALELSTKRIRQSGEDALRRRLAELGLVDIATVQLQENYRYRIETGNQPAPVSQMILRGDVEAQGERVITVDFLVVVEDHTWRIDGLTLALPDRPVIGLHSATQPRLVMGAQASLRE